MDLVLKSKLKEFVFDVVGACINVRSALGPYLNEYMYQDALEIEFRESGIEHVKEYYFSATYRGQVIKHRHYADFLVKDSILLECKAVENIGIEQRQQLWNYMRLSGIKVGVLYNFAPFKPQCERYYIADATSTPIAF